MAPTLARPMCSPIETMLAILFVIAISSISSIRRCEAFDSNNQYHDDPDKHFHESTHEDHHHKLDQHHDNLPKDKVLLRDVKVLTFTRHKRTTSRRTHSIHQLACVGGTAGCKLFTPDVVECHNDGLDKTTGKQQWRCRADMSDRVRFNHVEVICEGYDYPEDDYILLGSCGLEFTIDYADPHDHHEQSYFKHMDDHEKEMHHERVRKQQLHQKINQGQQSLLQLLLAVSQSFSAIALLVVVVIFLVLMRLVSSSSSSRGATSLDSDRKRPIGGAGYGPLTSAVMSTKKAC